MTVAGLRLLRGDRGALLPFVTAYGTDGAFCKLGNASGTDRVGVLPIYATVARGDPALNALARAPDQPMEGAGDAAGALHQLPQVFRQKPSVSAASQPIVPLFTIVRSHARRDTT